MKLRSAALQLSGAANFEQFLLRLGHVLAAMKTHVKGRSEAKVAALSELGDRIERARRPCAIAENGFLPTQSRYAQGALAVNVWRGAASAHKSTDISSLISARSPETDVAGASKEAGNGQDASRAN